MEKDSERRLAAIMFTDIVGYTALTQTDEALALDILTRHNQLLRPLFPKYHGREIKTIGDSFLVGFDSALDCTNCAIEIQKLLHDYNISTTSDNWKIKLRIGIHLGDVVCENDDIFGDAVNIASRLQPLAEPEGVCISQQVFDQIHNKIGYSLHLLPQTELKNVKFETNVYSVVLPWEENILLERNKQEEMEHLDKFRIAVLPFSSMSPDPNDEYFVDGMTEELISKISLINGLSVISRTSVMSYKAENLKKKMIDIGKELDVGTILEGSVRKAGSRVRISAQLIDVGTDSHLWSENYDRTLNDIFEIQSEIANKVASALRVKLLPSKEAQIKKSQTKDPEAHVLYLKGLASQRKRTTESLDKSIGYFEKAIERDPTYAEAFAAMAQSFVYIGFRGQRPSKQMYSKARTFAEKAIEINPGSAGAHLTLGSVFRLSDWDYRSAEKEYKRVLELNPNLADAHLFLAVLMGQEGRTDEALKETERGLELDPVSPNTLSTAGMIYLYLRNYERAVALLSDAKEIDPSTWGVHNLGLALVQSGKVSEGLHLIESRSQDSAEELMELAYAYTKAGRMEDARKMLSDVIERSKENPDWSAAVAGIYACLGETEEAIKWLEKAQKGHAGFLKAHLRVDFIFDPLRSDVRFISLLKKMELISTEAAPQAGEKRTKKTQSE